mgnify:CR=1 FL=1
MQPKEMATRVLLIKAFEWTFADLEVKRRTGYLMMTPAERRMEREFRSAKERVCEGRYGVYKKGRMVVDVLPPFSNEFGVCKDGEFTPNEDFIQECELAIRERSARNMTTMEEEFKHLLQRRYFSSFYFRIRSTASTKE